MSRPLAIIQFDRNPAEYSPTDVLTCEYRVELHPNEQADNRKIIALETSVLWRTEGKGDTDIGVHFFERREKKMVQRELLEQTQRLTAVLPTAPLSYAGQIVKVVWLVRVRMFMADGSEKTFDEVFQMGNVERFEPEKTTAPSEEKE